ncbi:acyltransferase [Desulfobotulus sp. H1]|uniref:Acyltransferase n=1 Tax=Desulfobotulus pelophilus TaxID=2823377 RepID=A0ABT3N5V8_9BACT|nr:acyltransferase [Desulfobotulus pelophilus]MCW7752848.1 acyltransferase [Desulfobotulus pelophilus]
MQTLFPSFLRGVLVITILSLSTTTLFIPIILLTFVKLMVPWKGSRKLITRVLILISTFWVHVNNITFSFFLPTQWDVRGGENLSPHGWYLVLCNHQSWVDILALQKIMKGKIPFLKFFLKQQLIWVPIMGIAWWALDFPFMKRYSREYILKHPHKKGKDLESTRIACEKFRTTPVSIMNFVEGTRITEAKHRRQKSPFHGLLKPKAAGTAFVIAAMGTQMNQIVDVTIAYPRGIPTFWQFVSGKTPLIRMHIRSLPIHEKLRGDYFNDPDFRNIFQKELNTLWQEKEKRLSQMQQDVWLDTITAKKEAA